MPKNAGKSAIAGLVSASARGNVENYECNKYGKENKANTSYPNSLILYKVGNFYQAYGKDAYIISYIFDYKINKVEPNIAVSGFPKNAISKIMANLERKSINFMILDTRNNYKVDEQEVLYPLVKV